METIEVRSERREEMVEIALVVSGGEPVLGTWQGVFLRAYDGPRRRQLAAQVLEAG